MGDDPHIAEAVPSPEAVLPASEQVAAAAAPPGQAASAPKKPGGFLRRGQGRGATGAQQKSQRPDAACGGLLAFLRGTGTDNHGRRLEDILEWDFDQMEKVHDYVQWIFPTDESSRYNSRVPLLTSELQRTARDDPEIRAAVRRALRKFCSFLGLEMVELDGEPYLLVRKSPEFDARAPVCWHTRGKGNHNWLRISRALHCLRLVGMDDEAAALLACLENLHAEGVRCAASLPFWRKRAATVPAWRRPSSTGEVASAPKEAEAAEALLAQGLAERPCACET